MRALVCLVVMVSACGDPAAEPLEPAPEAEPAPAPEPPRLIDLGSFLDAHHAPRRVRAWLPRAYASHPDERFPVLYVLDGQAAPAMLDVPASLDTLTEAGAIDPWIAILIDSTWARTHELADEPEHFSELVLDTIAPAVASELRVRDARRDTAILGYSYGGLAAVRAQLHRPDRIGRVIAMSPSLWSHERVTIRMARAADRALPDRAWIDVGSREGRNGEVVPYMVRDARALRDVWIERGMQLGRELGYLEVPGEAHGMPAGGRRMRTALASALGEVDLRGRAPSSVSIHVYPLARGTRERAFAVEARYAPPLRLTWPASTIDVRVEGATRPLLTDVAQLRCSALVAHIAGVEGRSR